MPARVPTPTKKRIARLAEEGFSQVEIARELSINRRTVANYIGGVGASATKGFSTLTLPPELLGKLQFLASAVGAGTCPSCTARMFFHAGQPSVKCPQCKETWNVVHERQVQRPLATNPGQTYRAAPQQVTAVSRRNA